MIQPNYVECVVDHNAMDATMLIYTQLKLPSRISAELFVQSTKSTGALGALPIMGMGS